jgi:transcriptional regulator GlxA family with amidase domain
MGRVLLVAFDGVVTLDLTGPAEVFAGAGRRLGRPVYEIVVASVGGGEIGTSTGLRVQTRDLRRIAPRRGDTVVVAGGEEAAVRAAMMDHVLLGWLRSARVARMTSVCSGAFILAAAGLLDGKRAATHWSACELLQRSFPRIHVDSNAIFVRDGHVWTSAGVTTGIDMALALLEEDHGRALADVVAAHLVLYVRRPGFQSQFSDALVAQTASSDPLGPAIAWVRANLDKADVAHLARRSGMSVRTLHRRCLDHLGTTPGRLIDKLRVDHARNLLESSALSLKTLSAQCGFGNATRLKRAFQRELGIAPREYRALRSASKAQPRDRRLQRRQQA